MAITHFIPKIWSAQMQMQYWETTVFAPLVNRDYEGDLTSGNVVKISGVVVPAIKDYKANNRTTSADDITDTEVEVPVDQEKNFDFYVDDIDRAQAAGSMDGYSQAASLGLAEDADQYIASQLVAGATAIGNTDPILDGDDAFDVIADLVLAMNQNKVPKAGRIVAINSLFHRQLIGANSKLTAVDASGDPMGLREATVGRLLGCRIITTENMPETAKPQAVAFNKDACAYVSQIQKVEGMRAQNKFADRLRGLHVYGSKVIRPEAAAKYTAA
ncbi:P22 phage major capsid protein family protein [Streptomyces sp. NPDC087437]|uniref:P22 phage major capsid protein family protein n=1 Tax=Streptomyces sp. NPDC087437 TaxID=3365789 RepID=UPI0037FFEC5E